MLPYTPPTPTATGFPARQPELSAIKDAMCLDLMPHIKEFDAIVCAGDAHGVALASATAACLWKPLMIVCPRAHDCVVSHIVMIGDIHPDMRFLYLDDMFAFGASFSEVMGYMAQSETPNVVAAYEYSRRHYAPCTVHGARVTLDR